MGEDPRAIEERIEKRREHMGDTVSALAYKADVPGRMKESVSSKKQAAGEKLASAKHGTQDSARRTVVMARENPLGLAIGAMAIGFVVGSLLPSTRVEEEKLGPVASEAREQVSELASEAVDHGKQVAEDAVQAAKETATESGQEHAGEMRDSTEEHLNLR